MEMLASTVVVETGLVENSQCCRPYRNGPNNFMFQVIQANGILRLVPIDQCYLIGLNTVRLVMHTGQYWIAKDAHVAICVACISCSDCCCPKTTGGGDQKVAAKNPHHAKRACC